ncbi:MAG: flagellar hook-length control protein FliK [Leptospiraceae bacterium]|nr:flagellar hook-length control protein FliK [Leptospiraceae bacterium]
MFIFNHLENLIFGKTPTEEIKKDNTIANKESNFNEILHQAVNDASRVEADRLQTYSTISESLSERRDVVVVEPFKAEIFQERISKDTKESFQQPSLSFREVMPDNASFYAPSETVKLESAQVNNKSYSQTLESEFKTIETDEFKKEKLETKEAISSKEVSSEILLQTFAKLEVEGQNAKDPKISSKKINLEAKLEEKKSSSDVESARVEGQTVVSLKATPKEIESKDSKKVATKTVSSEESLTKAKEVKLESDTKEILTKEVKREVLKDSEKVVKFEDNSKLSQTQPKAKEATVAVSNPKSQTEAKSDSNLQTANVFVGKEELSATGATVVEARKPKKSQELESKDKSNSENSKPIQKEFVGNEKEFRMTKETLVEVSGLDKNKWTITRREKEVEHANLERKKESVSLLNEIAMKSSSSQTSSDSDKSFSNSRFDANGFKTFSESMKTANSDKPREAGFDRENFSKSLNDLVSKARINIVENGRNSAQISLYPKDLGKMTLNIDVIKEKVEGKILVDSEFIKNRLLSDVSQLKADLKASGLDLQSISVEVRDHSSTAFDFANPSNEKDSAKEKSEKANSSLSQVAANEEQSESQFSNKSYNLVDIKI